jgi:O-antigen ligase
VCSSDLVNLVRGPEHVRPLFWLIIVCTGLQGLFGTLTYLAQGGVVTEQGIMTHDDSLFFNVITFVLLLLVMTRADRRLLIGAVVAAPCAVWSALANQRRASIAAFMIAFMPLVPLVWCVAKERRKSVARFGIAFLVFSAVYLPVAWNASGPWALPARAIRSQSDPSARDASSDLYRIAENENLKFTRDMQPWVGFGYGKKYIEVHYLWGKTTDMLLYMPHNSVLWVWMRIGHIGFLCFVMMFAVIFIRGTQNIKEVRHPLLQVAGILGVLYPLMLFTIGRYDLSLCNSRHMVAGAVFVGLLSALGKLDGQPGPRPAQEVVSSV